MADKDINFIVPEKFTSYIVKRTITDLNQYYFERYKKGFITRDSMFSIFKGLDRKIDTSEQMQTKTRNTLHVLIGLGKDSSLHIIPDINNNYSFQDDIELKTKDSISYFFKTQLDYVLYKKIVKTNFTFEIKLNSKRKWNELQDDFSVLIRSATSKTGSIKIGNTVFKFELVPSNFSNFYALNNIDVIFSQPNEKLAKVDFINNASYNAERDTIFSGRYRFKIIQADFWGKTAQIEYLKIDKSKSDGYQEGFKFKNFSFYLLGDSVANKSKIYSIRDLIENKQFLLIDFWGTWCTPCLKNFPVLKSIDTKFASRGLATIGFSAENDDDTTKVRRSLSNNGINWPNVFLNRNSNNTSTILQQLKIISFPTYILIDKNFRIIIRSVGADGLKRIEDYLSSHL
jgi:thiol-disulfide isomerase/thioredoxin